MKSKISGVVLLAIGIGLLNIQLNRCTKDERKPRVKANSTMIKKETALKIAREKIAPFFGEENLTAAAHLSDGKWIVQFRRTPPSPGGEPRLVIDAKTGDVLEFNSSQ